MNDVRCEWICLDNKVMETYLARMVLKDKLNESRLCIEV